MINMFHSARLKLTVFYLAILLFFSLALTFGIRAIALREYDRSNRAQLGEVYSLQKNFFDQSIETFVLPPPRNTFENLQQDQNDLVRKHLNEDIIIFNICALIVGGVLSYWYAGRTLKPIIDAHDAQKRFASDASHELRTPLANMKVENEVFLRQKTFSETEARELITSNLEEVQRLESLADNLLHLSQYEKNNLHLGSVPIKTVVDNALAASAKALDANGIKIERKLAPAHVLGDRESLEQLLTIVIDNAIKYGPKKGTVYLTGNKSSNHYCLKVRDEGPGIAAEDLPHIFERLYRGDKARTSKAEGYGLGLALAKQMAEANQATITAANAKPKGAEFKIQLGLVHASRK
ncbi:MAG TPA: HAMP domain-containing sensor histidine kinase [Candidatus Saccharimonadales bacterium]|nr:HAMP domain-containing sensor histidine kinase [Candidatus Saccharimonadales bacterium]